MKIKALLAGVISVIMLRVLYVHFTRSETKANYPLTLVKQEPGLISIYLADSAALSEVVNVSLFKGARPNMEEEQLLKILGPEKALKNKPDRSVTILNIPTILNLFETDSGRIEHKSLAEYREDEFGNSHYFETYMLVLYKNDIKSSAVFTPPVLKYLPKDIGDKKIKVFEEDECCLTISLSDKEDDWMEWRQENEFWTLD